MVVAEEEVLKIYAQDRISPGILEPVYGGFWKTFRYHLRGECAWAVRIWKPGRYFFVPCWLVSSGQCLVQQWLHVPVLFLDAFGRISNFFHVLGSSDRFSSCSPWCSLSLSLLKARFKELDMDCFVLQNGVVCTVDAVIALILPSFKHLKFGYYFISPCIRQAWWCGFFGAPVSFTCAG